MSDVAVSALPAPEGLPADLRLIAADLDRLLAHVGELVKTEPDAHDLYVAVYQAAMTAVRLQGGAQ